MAFLTGVFGALGVEGSDWVGYSVAIEPTLNTGRDTVVRANQHFTTMLVIIDLY